MSAPKATSHATDVAASAPPAARGAPSARSARPACAVTTTHPVTARHDSSASAAVRDRRSTDWARAMATRSLGARGRSGSRNRDARATAPPTTIATGASTPISASVSSPNDGGCAPAPATP